jgi:hypothetical protein
MHLASPNAHLLAINQQCYLAAFSLHFISSEQSNLTLTLHIPTLAE